MQGLGEGGSTVSSSEKERLGLVAGPGIRNNRGVVILPEEQMRARW